MLYYRYYNNNQDVKEDEEFGNFLKELAVDDESIEPPYGDYSSGEVSLQSNISSVVRLVAAIVLNKCL